jgi:hypothetical protein
MKSRSFNSVMPKYNEKWAAKVLGMNVNPNSGPDLIDSEKAVEVKFKMFYTDERYFDKCWRVLGHQVDYDKKHSEIYWSFGFYTLDREVKEIRKSDIPKLESFVLNRELYLVEWDWIKQFPKYHHQGKTAISEWNHFLLYPRMNRKFPKIISSEKVEGELFILLLVLILQNLILKEKFNLWTIVLSDYETFINQFLPIFISDEQNVQMRSCSKDLCEQHR